MGRMASFDHYAISAVKNKGKVAQFKTPLSEVPKEARNQTS